MAISDGLGRFVAQPDWLGLKVGIVLHSSDKPGELSQLPCHDDSTIKTVATVTITIISTIMKWCFW